MEFLAVFLVAAALIFVAWGLFGLLLAPVFRQRMLTISLERGDAGELEQKVRAYGWLREQGGGTLLIVDCGMTAQGLELAQALCRRYDWVEYCPCPALEDYIAILQDTV